MAPLTKPGADRIYAMHHRWLCDVLGPGDSLLTPGASIWTVDLLDELESQFIDQPDLTKGKRFLEKLRDQLAGAAPSCVQLMAEVHVVHFLMIWNGAISANKKVSDLNAILSWMPEPPTVQDDVADVMSPGIAHPGQWAMTRRDTQITWLIHFSRSWKDLSEERQQRLISDPWELRDFAESVHAPASDSARLSLLHLAHPDTFEAIVAPDHKRLIANRFADGTETEDPDRVLLELRQQMSSDYGDDFEWYDEPLVYRWWKNAKAWPALLEWAKRLRAEPEFEAHERTYKLDLASRLSAVRDALRSGEDSWLLELKRIIRDQSNNLTQWQTHESFLDWAEEQRDNAEVALQTLWDEQRHPIDRLGAFVSQLPTSARLGSKGARLNIGSFLLMAEDPQHYPPTKISPVRKAWALANWSRDDEDMDVAAFYERALVLFDELARDSAEWDVPLADRLDAQGAVWAITKITDNLYRWPEAIWQEFVDWRETKPSDDDDEDTELSTGAVGLAAATEPTSVDHIAQAAEDLNVDREALDEIVELLEDKGQVVLYGPPGTGKTFLAARLATAIAERDPARRTIVQFHPATSYEDFFEGLRPRVTDAGHVTYERTDGPLVAMAERAANDQPNAYVLVVDEINRANLPKVFGELLFLLEHRDESAQTLYRPTTPFQLPTNLWFIGTMNTADRSVALIDAAMRRRFHFVPFFPHEGPMKDLLRRWLAKKGGRTGVARLLDAVNKELVELVGEHLLIGPSHFMKTDLSDKSLERIWTYNVFPLIEEQLWGNREEIARWRWDAVSKRFAAALAGKSTEVDTTSTTAPDEEPSEVAASDD